MSEMFDGCRSLKSLDLSNFDTSKVTSMECMFRYCDSLTSLDVSNFNTSNVTNMSQMFQSCKSLKSLDLSNFDTSNVTNMSEMFWDCRKLETIFCENKWTATNSSDMFDRCILLKGAVSYDDSRIGVAMANPDTGYFTRKIYYDLWLCGTQVSNTNCPDLTRIRGVTLAGEGAYAYYNPDNKTLYLHRVSITSDKTTPLKTAIDGLTIACGEPVGDIVPSFVQCTSSTVSCALEVAANTTIQGSDALFVLGGYLTEVLTKAVYLSGGNLTVDNGNLIAIGTSGLQGKTGVRWTRYYSLIVKGKSSSVMAMGAGGVSVGGLESLELSDGLAITSPEGAEFVDGYVSLRSDVSIDPVTNEGVIIQYVEPDHIPGDVNEDGSVDINDVVAIINVMAGNATWPNANVNGDTGVDINDVVAVINIMAGH